MDYDVIIVGAGSMGMAAGYYLAKEGKNVLMLDAFTPHMKKVVIMGIQESFALLMVKELAMYLS